MSDTAQSESAPVDNIVALSPPADTQRPPPDNSAPGAGGDDPPRRTPRRTTSVELRNLLLGNTISAVVVVGCFVMAIAMVIQLYMQLSNLNAPPATTALATLNSDRYLGMSIENREQIALYALENDAQYLRTNRAQSLVAAKLFVQSISVLAGIALIVMGSSFVFARIKTEEPTKTTGSGNGFAFTLDTYSPGLVLAAFGTILIATAVLVSPNQTTRTQDAAVFLPQYLPPGVGYGQNVAPPVQKTPEELRAEAEAAFKASE